MIIANSGLCTSWLSTISHPMRACEIIVKYPSSNTVRILLFHQKRNELMNLSADKADSTQKGRSKTISTEENSKGKVWTENLGELKSSKQKPL